MRGWDALADSSLDDRLCTLGLCRVVSKWGKRLRIYRSCIIFALATKKLAILFLSSVG